MSHTSAMLQHDKDSFRSTPVKPDEQFSAITDNGCKHLSAGTVLQNL